MSQANVEKIVGRLVTDEDFRRAFHEGPERVVRSLADRSRDEWAHAAWLVADADLPGMPVERAEDAAYLRLLTRGAEVPTDAEVADNPRAASARLRAAERIRETLGESS